MREEPQSDAGQQPRPRQLCVKSGSRAHCPFGRWGAGPRCDCGRVALRILACRHIKVSAVELGGPLRLQKPWISVPLRLRRELRGRWDLPQKPWTSVPEKWGRGSGTQERTSQQLAEGGLSLQQARLLHLDFPL